MIPYCWKAFIIFALRNENQQDSNIVFRICGNVVVC